MCLPGPLPPVPPLPRRMEEWEKLEIARQIALRRRDRPGIELASQPLSAGDQKRLVDIRARQAARTAKYQRRQALKPSALFSRLKARAARVTWDSWG